jgi:hypothetical protein
VAINPTFWKTYLRRPSGTKMLQPNPRGPGRVVSLHQGKPECGTREPRPKAHDQRQQGKHQHAAVTVGGRAGGGSGGHRLHFQPASASQSPFSVRTWWRCAAAAKGPGTERQRYSRSGRALDCPRSAVTLQRDAAPDPASSPGTAARHAQRALDAARGGRNPRGANPHR